MNHQQNDIFFLAKELAYTNIDNILELLGLNSYGNRIICPCPIHGGDNPTGFTFYKNKNAWGCWTHHCEEEFGSDIIGLVAGLQSLSRYDAAKWILNVCNGSLEDYDPLEIERKKFLRNNKREEKIAPKIYNKELLSGMDGNVPYFMNRGFSLDILKRFYGFAANTPGKRLYRRACFPIFDPSDNIIGFTGRSVVDQDPKWLFMPQGIAKNQTFFGLMQARESIKQSKTVILVEGQLDVLRMHDFGHKNTLGLFGCSISLDQIKLLGKLGVYTIILCLDPDTAGKEAVEKVTAKCESYFKVYNLTDQLSNDPSKISKEEMLEFSKKIKAISDSTNKYEKS